MLHPLLAKYGLEQYGTASHVPRAEVISLCEQLEWTEREVKKAREAAPKTYKRKRQWKVAAAPNPRVATHRVKPTAVLAGLTALLPLAEFLSGKGVSDLGVLVLVVGGLFFVGHWLIYLVFHSS